MSGQTTEHIVFNDTFDHRSIKIPPDHFNLIRMEFPHLYQLDQYISFQGLHGCFFIEILIELSASKH